MATLVVSAGYQDEGAAAGIAKVAAAEDSLAAKTIAKSNAIKATKQAEAAELRRIRQAELNEWRAAENEKDRILAREIANKKMTFARLAELDRRRYDEERAARKKAELDASRGSGRGIFGGGTGGGGMIAGMAGGLAGMIGLSSLTAAIGTLTTAFTEYQQKQVELAQKGEATGATMKAFLGIQKGTQAQKDASVERAIKLGATEGLTPEQTVGLAQPLQSTIDTTGKWDTEEAARFVPAARMQKLGVPADVAGQVSQLGVNRGLAPGQAEDWISLAADISVTDEPAIAKAAALGGSQYSNLPDALGAATAISAAGLGGISGERITPLMEALNKTIGSAGEVKYEKMFKRYKLGSYGAGYGEAPLSEAENVARLREVAITQGDQSLSEEERITAFSQNVAKELGVVDVEDAKALGAAMRNFGEWQKVTTGIASGVADGAVNRKLETLKANPITAATLEGEKTAALEGVRGIYGGEAQSARETIQDKRAGGAWWRKEGEEQSGIFGIDWVDAEGNETMMGKFERKMRGMFLSYSLMSGSQPTGLESMQNSTLDAMLPNGRGPGSVAPEETAATRENTEATRQLTEQLRAFRESGAPMPLSAPSPINRNAGE